MLLRSPERLPHPHPTHPPADPAPYRRAPRLSVMTIDVQPRGPSKPVVSEPRRLLARLQGAEPGPTLVCIGSLHGNEPAGYWALERVIATLEAARRDTGFELVRGCFMALAGNLQALREGRRYLDHDLNRGWLPERIEELQRRAPRTAEEREVIELVECANRARNEARGPLVLLDLHSTSGDSPPFVNVADRLAYRSFARHFQSPVVLGIDDYLNGTLLEWFDRSGFLGVVFEGGRHDAPASIDHNEAAVWIALDRLGLLGRDAARHPMLGEPLERAPALLRAASRGLPRMLEIQHRYEIANGTPFRMAPGFKSFQPLKANTLLAYEAGREVRAGSRGRLLMPLYQPQGDDGFFVMRTYSASRRILSWLARRSGLASVLRWLPGITGVADEPGTLAVENRWRRGASQTLLRLFGYHAVSTDAGRWRLRQRI